MDVFAKGKHQVLVISDFQAPFQHRDSYDFLDAVARRYRTTTTVCIGDEVDFHALSDYDANPDGLSPGDELRAAIAALRPLYQRFPVVYSCESNHTSRPFRRAYAEGFPRGLLKSYNEFLQAPKGWRWAPRWEIDGVLYEHGDALNGTGRYATQQLPLRNAQSTVFGHFHSFAGVQYLANPKFLYFGMNVGCLIDYESYAFEYGRRWKEKPIVSCGVVINGLPTVVPMVLNRRGRWVGRLP